MACQEEQGHSSGACARDGAPIHPTQSLDSCAEVLAPRGFSHTFWPPVSLARAERLSYLVGREDAGWGQLFPRDGRDLRCCPLSQRTFLAPFLTSLKVSLESPPSKGDQELGSALLPGRVKVSRGRRSRRGDFVLSPSSLTATIIII